MIKILHLTLKKKWFDLIKAGEKTKEYREVKPYWTTRLENKVYDEIHFRNGYSKNSPFMKVEWKGMKKENDQYVILLGKILR
jgi:ASC-1-like (ASCH) protein